MKKNHRSILITGASGFIGKYFVEKFRDQYTLFALARRSIVQSGISYHPNIHWLQCDITNKDRLVEVGDHIKKNGGVSFIIHLAAYYDFDYKDKPEYLHTNVEGTRNMLLLAKELKPRHFIFASSLAACNFPARGTTINEETSPDADFAYARSKKQGELMCKEFSQFFPCTAIRLAAVFSDWCEYAPLYQFLKTWLGNNWKSRILGGKGESAITYIFILDLFNMVQQVFFNSGNLHNFNTFIASPEGSVSHNELYSIATRDYFGQTIKPLHFPKAVAFFGLFNLTLLSKLKLGPKPFEQLWMMKYIDQKLNINNTYTRNTLSWEPNPRYHIKRRMLFMLVNMKSHVTQWDMINEAGMKHASNRPNLQIYEYLAYHKDEILNKINSHILSKHRAGLYPGFQKMKSLDFQSYTSSIYNMIIASVRTGDRSLLLRNIDDMAIGRFTSGFSATEVCEVLSVFKNIILTDLLFRKEFQNLKQEIYDYISMSIQLAQDQIEDVYESMGEMTHHKSLVDSDEMVAHAQRKEMMKVLNEFYQNNPY